MANGSRNELIITWRIVNFSILCQDPNYNGVRSPTFLAENLEKSHFYIILIHRGMNSVDEKCVSCCLVSDIAAGDETVSIECAIKITDAGEETLQSKIFSKSSDPEYQAFGLENFIKIDELLNKMKNYTEDTLTVHCHIVGEVQTSQPKTECEAVTKIGVDRCHFVWKVEMPNTPDWSESKNFFFHDQTPIKVTLSAPEDDILIYIKNERKTDYFVTCRMSLVDDSGNERCSRSANHSFRGNNEANWKFPTFFTKTQLKDKKNLLLPPFSFLALPKDPVLTRDTFNLTCEFSIPNGINFKEVRYRTLPYTDDAVSSLLDDWSKMFTSKTHAGRQ